MRREVARGDTAVFVAEREDLEERFEDLLDL